MNGQPRLLVALLLSLAAVAGVLTWASSGSEPAKRSGWFGYTPLSATPIKSGNDGSGGSPGTVLHVRVTTSAAYQADRFRARAGVVRIDLACAGTAALEIAGVKGFVLTCPSRDGGDSGLVVLGPGTYTIESPIAGHQAAGQKATLIVTR